MKLNQQLKSIKSQRSILTPRILHVTSQLIGSSHSTITGRQLTPILDIWAVMTRESFPLPKEAASIICLREITTDGAIVNKSILIHLKS
jgi:hypothetical protein